MQKYPKEIADRFVEETRRNYKKKVEANRRSGKSRPYRKLGSQKPYRQLGYRKPCGQLRSVYDCYKPEAPHGCEIGVVTVHPNLKFYANGTYGYEYIYSGFTPIKDVDLSVESVIKA